VRRERGTRLTIACADRPGIVADVAGFLRDRGANIVHSDQHSTDPVGGRFFMRMEVMLPIEPAERAGFDQQFDERVARPAGMRWRISYPDDRPRIAILVSREDHCLFDLLWRRRREELDAEIVLVVSNHAHHGHDVTAFDVPFHHVPVDPGEKRRAEGELLQLLRGQVDLVVLARYMQILSGEFLEQLAVPVINIHHSFLPSFPGRGPYARAKKRGVKLIGATAHYVVEELDAGPIIEQDVLRVTHRDDIEHLEQLGRDIERAVLARAVRWHCEDRVLIDGNTTVVF